MPVSPEPSTIEAVFGVISVEGMHSLISLRRFPCTKDKVANKCLVEKIFRNLDCVDVRYFAIHLHCYMHQS